MSSDTGLYIVSDETAIAPVFSNPFSERESDGSAKTDPMRKDKGSQSTGVLPMYGFSTIEEGLALFRQRGLVLLCWVIVFALPVLFLRDAFLAENVEKSLEMQLITGVRIALLTSALLVIVSTRLIRNLQLGSLWLQQSFFVLCILMVALTVVEKGGATSPIYAGFLTVLVGWGYFFSMPALTMAMLSSLVVIGYVCVLAWRTDPSISQWEQVFIHCVYLLIGAACAAYAATIHLRSQVKRFETILTEHHLAGLDPLTSVMNRKAVTQRIRSAQAEHERYQQEMACLLIDVDDLKNINQRWGEDAGDEVLIHVSNLITGLIGSQGEIGRWRGDEFVVVLNATNRRKALIHAERLRAAIERSSLQIQGVDLSLTVSIGVGCSLIAENEDEEPNHTSTIGLAQQALYSARRHGKNRVGAFCRGSVSPNSLKDESVHALRIPPMPPLSAEAYDRWIRRQSRKGYVRMNFMLCGVLVSTGLLESLATTQVAMEAQQSATLLRLCTICALLSGLWLVRSSVKAYLNVIRLQYLTLILAGLAFCALTITTESQSGPGFILPMILLLIGSCTTPGGAKYGVPAFGSLCLMWPLMVMATGNYETHALLTRSSIILIMGITCTLCHHHFHKVALQQAQIQNHLNRLSLSDGLTGAWNRRGFDARLIHLCDVSNRSDGFLSLVLLDLRDLESIALQHGEDTAYSAVRHFADMVHGHIRSPDILARLDKSKFALILPQTRSTGAVALITRIKNALEDSPYISSSIEVVHVEAAVGISEHKGTAMNPKFSARALIDHAEAALFAARERRSKRESRTYQTSPTHRHHKHTRVIPSPNMEPSQS
jgi:diguanylate cyclase (GGDEF)-like protein